MEQKKYTITILFDGYESTINLTTDKIELIQLHNIMSSLDEIGEIQSVIDYEID